MSTGGYTDDFRHYGSLGIPPGEWVGSYTQRSFSGDDSPKVVTPKREVFYILREEKLRDGRTVVRQYKVRRPGERPPKRARREDHVYHMEYTRLVQNFAYFQPLGPLRQDMGVVGAPGSWAASDLLDANDQIKLVGKLREKLQGSDFNASVFLGEGHQTLKMLGDSAVRIAKSLWHLKKLDFYGAARSLFEGTSRKPLAQHDWVGKRPLVPSVKNLSNLWLELQYGWLPLLKDAEGCAQSLAHALGSPMRTTHRVSVRKEENRTVVTSGSQGPGFDWTTYIPVRRFHRRGLIARISEDPLTIPQLLGLQDPELVAWELTPFSFVADWFIPIGSWMDARALSSKLTGTFITSDMMVGSTGKLSYTGGGLAMAQPDERGSYDSAIFNRSVSTTLAVPMPSFKRLDKVASWRHCANAIALLTQRAREFRS